MWQRCRKSARNFGWVPLQRTVPSPLALVVILTVIPQATTAPNQTALTRIVA
jgi:hypothetical protein